LQKLGLVVALLTLGVLREGALCVGPNHGRPRVRPPGRQGKLTKLPKLVEFVEAPYPESEKAAGKMASVVLQIAITDKGTVRRRRGDPRRLDRRSTGKRKRPWRSFASSPLKSTASRRPSRSPIATDFHLQGKRPKQPVVNYDGVVMNRFTKKPIQGAKNHRRRAWAKQ